MSATTNNTNKRGSSPTLWSTYHEIRKVLDKPVIEKRVTNIIYDDSKRVVDLTEIKPNLYIGGELVSWLIYTNTITIWYNYIIFDNFFLLLIFF